MPAPGEAKDLTAKVEEMLAYATASERLRSLMALMVFALEELRELLEEDNDLLPELNAAAANLGEAAAAMRRAHSFAGERMAVRLGMQQGMSGE